MILRRTFLQARSNKPFASLIINRDHTGERTLTGRKTGAILITMTCVIGALAAGAAPPKTATSKPQQAGVVKLRYNRDIRPILAENCFPCHGPDSAARKAGLRIDK